MPIRFVSSVLLASEIGQLEAEDDGLNGVSGHQTGVSDILRAGDEFMLLSIL